MGVHPFVKFFLVVWLAVIGVGGIVAVIEAVVAINRGNQPAMIYHPFFMVIGGIIMVKFGRWLARNEGAFLITKVTQTIGGHYPAE